MKPLGIKQKPIKLPESNPAPAKRREKGIDKPRRVSLNPEEGKQRQAE